ncbi:MAG: pyrimidine reductase [Gemmatimonadota bacterium]|nr:pyrimidine reductase [Gemmatimonadota bacterium]
MGDARAGSTADDKCLRKLPLDEPSGRPLHGAHLDLDLRGRASATEPYVYAGFIASLDGRIALDGRAGPPRAVANDRDWRLFMELAMQADVVLSSARYVRERSTGLGQGLLPEPADERFRDLIEWRGARGLPERPCVGVLTSSGDLDPEVAAGLSEDVFVLSGARPPRDVMAGCARMGVDVVVIGADASTDAVEDGGRLEGGQIVDALTSRGHRVICSMAGPIVLHALAPRLDALFLTVVARLVGGLSYSSLLEGPELAVPKSFTLAGAHLDAAGPGRASQLFLEFRAA